MRTSFVQDGDPLDPNAIRCLEAVGRCPFCSEHVRIPLPPDADCTAEATFWKEEYGRLLGKLNSTIKDVEAKTGENPSILMWGDQLKRLRDMINRLRKRKES